MKKLHEFTAAVALSLLLLGCGGGGGSHDNDPEFPTPTLPSGATKIDAANAEEIGNSALEFTDILSEFAARSEDPPSIPHVIRRVTELFINRSPGLQFRVAGKTENVSAMFCSSGTAMDTFDERTNSVSGEVRFSNCNIGFGMTINGSFPYEVSWNETTLNYRFRFGGRLVFEVGGERITAVFNFVESGNDGTGDFTLGAGFSLAGIPGMSFLLKTQQPLSGNFFTAEVTAGELIVEGADSTRLCMEVTAINTVTVEFDDGLGGGCAPLAPPLVIFM